MTRTTPWHWITVCIIPLAVSVRAQTGRDQYVPVWNVQRAAAGADGGIASDAIVYENTVLAPGMPYFTTDVTPRWHVGESGTFVPGPGAGHRDLIVKRMVVSVGNTSGSTQNADIMVAFWEKYDAAAGSGIPVYSGPIGGFTLINNQPLDSGYVRLTTVDLSSLPGGGFRFPRDTWFVQIRYLAPGTTDPQLGVSPVFNAGTDFDLDGIPDGPAPGSSADEYFRDLNGDGVLTNVPSERRQFPTAPNRANLVFRLEAELPCEPCDVSCDGTTNLFDVQPFLNALAQPPTCSPCAGDTNGDATVNQFDINGFITCLLG